MNQIRFDELKEIGFVKSFLKNLVPYLHLTAEERQEKHKLSRESFKRRFTKWIKITKVLYDTCKNDKQFAVYIGIDITFLKERLYALEQSYNNYATGKRASPNKEIYVFVQSIVWTIHDESVKTNEIIEFIYKIFCDNHFDDFNNDYMLKDSFYIDKIELAKKDRIRKEFVDPALKELRNTPTINEC